jgi:hypothetical protein
MNEKPANPEKLQSNKARELEAVRTTIVGGRPPGGIAGHPANADPDANPASGLRNSAASRSALAPLQVRRPGERKGAVRTCPPTSHS